MEGDSFTVRHGVKDMEFLPVWGIVEGCMPLPRRCGSGVMIISIGETMHIAICIGMVIHNNFMVPNRPYSTVVIMVVPGTV